MRMKLITKAFSLLAITFLLAGCKSGPKQETSIESNSPDTLASLVKVENAIFPIPSPWQITRIIQKVDIPFNESLLHNINDYQKYTTSFKQALNLGVYGTDLSYLNMYEKTQESLQRLGVVKKLSEQLGITETFQPSLFERIENNIDKKDSLMKILSDAYATSDLYLKQNERYDIGALIVAGCWIESMYIMTQIAQNNNNRELITRIGEQKHPLDNLIELLTPFYFKSQEFSDLLDKLIDLAYEFDGVIYTYSYREPIIDEKNKTITINSQSRVVMSEYHIKIISKKIEQIRKSVIE
ncbi:putative periplasmic lipoprotein [Tenuifilum thalassicum]|uniref:Lipoprotein n=1 Tax=Tenuifilum thalassicum TaxID=2590900 RepID=A0A7D4BS81_9BACT|nr:hypothetical protein [Tenuifilum thalassicum]QKG80181.1 hypothetical protein FHG85_07880 [Tenuifilum thalassicum]